MELEQQRFFRYILPGVATVFVTAVSFLVAFPWIVGNLLCWLERLIRIPIWEMVLVTFVGSGALGFILVQMYFAFPCFSLADHTPIFEKFRLQSEHKENWNDYKEASCNRGKAWALTHMHWQLFLAKDSRMYKLNETTTRLATFKCSIGATLIGLLAGFIAWVAFVVFERSSVAAFWHPLLAACVFLVPVILLYRSHNKVREHLAVIVNNTMRDKLPGEKKDATSKPQLGKDPTADGANSQDSSLLQRK